MTFSFLRRTLFAVGFLAASAVPAAAQQPRALPPAAAAFERTGEWVGGSDLFGRGVSIMAELPAEPGRGVGRFTSLGWSAIARPMTVETGADGELRFEFPSTTGVPFVGAGRREGNVISGTISRGEERGSFHLVALAAIPADAEAPFIGTYDGPGGSEFLISRDGFGHLRLVIAGSINSVALFPSSATDYFFGNSVIGSTSPGQTLSFTRDAAGRVSGFIIRQESRPDVVANRVERYAQQAIRFRNGDVQLSGTLVLPSRTGRHPVVVLTEGSGDWTRDTAWWMDPVNVFLRRGIGVFIYDKRGVGQSGGDWRRSSYGQLSEDLLAAIRALRRHPNVDRARIGARGMSQGGWIASLAASRSSHLAFLISLSASAAGTVEAQDTQSLIERMRADGFSEGEVEEARRLLGLTYQAPHSPAAWTRMQAVAEALRARPWFGRTIAGLPRDAWVWQQRRLNAGYDPAPAFERVRVPTLIIYGELDRPEASIPRLERALAIAANRDFEIRVLPGANHNLEVAGSSGSVLAEGFLDLVGDWTARRVCTPARPCAVVASTVPAAPPPRPQ
jgi:pimeloyl-ACP methyl ester carboxylesterase